MKKRTLKALLCLLLISGLLSGSIPVCAAGESADNPPVQPLKVIRRLAALQAVGGVDPWSEYWAEWNKDVRADLSSHPGLAFSLTFGTDTSFSEALPAGYDPEKLLEWGKYPGLNIDLLHQHGYTGKGTVIAYIDQPIPEHEQYTRDSVHYINNTNAESSMHGPAVLSLLTGRDIGTAPEAEVYFYGHAAWEADQTTHSECLYQIIEQNKSLPEDRKIRMVAFSDNIDETEKNTDAFRTAVAACEASGVMVWFCGDYAPLSFIPFADKNTFESLAPTTWGDNAPPLVYVPSSGRTTAAGDGGYIYWSNGGLSWTMPYVFGLYAIALQVDPSLTREALCSLIQDTAYVDELGRRIVNPVPFIAAVLQGAGREDEARDLLDDLKARTRYLYAVMDTAALSEADLSAIGKYLASVTDATVLVVDAARFSDAQEVYAAMRQDAEQRGGAVAGVQIFGTPAMIPAFSIGYKVQMVNGVDDAGTLLTDLFYGTFANDPELLSPDYNVMDHLASGREVRLVPEWPVVRLPLSRDGFSDFFRKYDSFILDTGLQRLPLVNFSNPIFKQKDHSDDMGLFLSERMDREFHLLDVPFRLYGNLKGEYPVTGDVLGGFEAENMAAENRLEPVEFIVNTHGQWDNIDNAFFVSGEEQRVSLINIQNINSYLAGNPYYLDAWTCSNGSGMADNLTTAALSGRCVGMFSATAIISNNGVNWRASLPEMAQSNFYYFYYSYLKALHEGLSRSRAFFTAQQAYGEALMADSRLPLRGEGNVQFNLYNLLAYHNFGVIEPNRAAVALYASGGVISQAPESVQKSMMAAANNLPLSDGNPNGKAKKIQFTITNELPKGTAAKVKEITAQPLDNEHTRFTVTYQMPAQMGISIFNPPDGDLLMLTSRTDESGELVFDLSNEDLAGIKEITLGFSMGNNRLWAYFRVKQLGIKSSAPKPKPTDTPPPVPQPESRAPGGAISIRFGTSNGLPAGTAAGINGITAEPLEGGAVQFTVDYSFPEGMNISVFDPPDGDRFMLFFSTDESGELVFELSGETLASTHEITLNFYNDDGQFFAFFPTDQVK